jgi:hypothetical protein
MYLLFFAEMCSRGENIKLSSIWYLFAINFFVYWFVVINKIQRVIMRVNMLYLPSLLQQFCHLYSLHQPFHKR